MSEFAHHSEFFYGLYCRSFLWIWNFMIHSKRKGGLEMNSRKTQMEMQSNSGTSEEHLCYIVSQGFHLTDEQSYLIMTSDSKFRCGHCGKQAVHDRNLCVPMELWSRWLESCRKTQDKQNWVSTLRRRITLPKNIWLIHFISSGYLIRLNIKNYHKISIFS